MAFIHSVSAMVALFIAPMAGWVAFQSFRERDMRLGLGSACVALVAAAIWLSAPKNETRYSDNCYIDWDARSNATVCD